VTRLTHSKCRGVSGSGIPKIVAKNMVAISPILQDIRKVRERERESERGREIERERERKRERERERERQREVTYIAGYQEGHKCLHIGIYIPPFLYSRDYGGEIIIS
jgi:ADP-ribosylglycohydrolase